MHQLIRRMLAPLIRLGYDKSVLRVHDGINIGDLVSSERAQEELWGRCAVGALELIQEHAPRRYRRIRKHLRYVINRAANGVAHYDHVLRSCQLDFARFRHIQDPDWCRLQLARALVHEATRGAVFAGRPPSTLEDLLRVERLCHREEDRFTRRVRPDLELPAFDERWHRELYSQNVWQRLHRVISRLRQGDQPAV